KKYISMKTFLMLLIIFPVCLSAQKEAETKFIYSGLNYSPGITKQIAPILGFYLVDKKRMNLMPGKQGRIECGNHIVNCARGGIIDEVALLTALENGTVTSAALDVFEVEPVTTENKLIQHPNFHGTPHIGAATKEAQSRVGLDIAAAVIEALSGKKPQTLVNSKYLD
ncbi:MAG: hypothetical protein HOM85_00385, partial [Euryarchaeota archaeon]|nr:hypothetical protein [Euryarchaeota archaeon]